MAPLTQQARVFSALNTASSEYIILKESVLLYRYSSRGSVAETVILRRNLDCSQFADCVMVKGSASLEEEHNENRCKKMLKKSNQMTAVAF
jgi:hypothetical protein